MPARSSVYILSRKSIEREKQNKKLRETLWPTVSSDQIWSRKTHDGFATVPRTLSLISVILDHLAEKGQPVAAVYFDLWCRSNDEGVVKLQGQAERMAQSSGFSGQRAVSSWTRRLDMLAKLGFILLAEGSSKRSNALILNPYLVIRNYRKQGLVPDDLWNSLQEWALEIKATDVTNEPSDQAPKEKGPKNSPHLRRLERAKNSTAGAKKVAKSKTPKGKK